MGVPATGENSWEDMEDMEDETQEPIKETETSTKLTKDN